MLKFIENKLAEAETQEQVEILRSIRSMIIDLRLCKAGLDSTTARSLIEYTLADEIATAIEKGILDGSAMKLLGEERARTETVTPELLHFLDLRDEHEGDEE